MKKPGIKELRCEECGATREVEMGIRTMYHCATLMVEVIEEEEAPRPAPPRRGDNRPGIQLNPR